MADPVREPLEAVLRRLKEERDRADLRYNETLTALDQTIRPPVALPRPVAGGDDHQVAALNDAWNILPAAPQASGLRGRLAGFIWRIVAPYLQRQLTFNSLLVDHVNRNAAGRRDAQRAAEATVAALDDQLAALAGFQARLMLYLQQITAFVDTKDRESASSAQVLNSALNSSLSWVAEDVAKRLESLAAREHRYEARVTALSAVHEELRSMIGVAQLGLVSLKREVERLEGSPRAAPDPGSRIPDPGSSAVRDAFGLSLDAYKYVGFEDQFRGSRDEIRARLESYLPLFAGKADVLDVGCGRGEFLDLLAARGIAARGIDLNHEMAENCRARGLDVAEADAVGYLSALPDGTLGGIFSAQVVEHLQPGYLLRFLELAFHKLRPGGRLVIETLNPACWVAFFDSYIRDITHVWPLHPETLRYLVVASGFTKAAIEFRSPVPPDDRLQPIVVPADADDTVAEIVEAFNANQEKLNRRIFTYQDYAIVGETPVVG
jgi:O-antigen chain-terminating methyltransferase